MNDFKVLMHDTVLQAAQLLYFVQLLITLVADSLVDGKTQEQPSSTLTFDDIDFGSGPITFIIL